MSIPDTRRGEDSTKFGAILRRVNLPSFLPVAESACLVALASLLFWKGILPGWRALNTDFPNYYLVARLLREGYSLDRIYDWVWLQRIKDHWGLDQSLVGFAGLTPFSALPVLPLSFYSALVAKRLWIIANVFFLAGSVELLTRATSLRRRHIWLLCLLAIVPLHTSFLYGQMHLLVLFLLVLAYFFHLRERPAACALCLSIAGALKIYPLMFVAYFLWKGRRREVVVMIGSVLLLLGMGYAWIGSHVMQTYIAEILPRSLQGEILDPYSARAASGSAFFHRLFIFEPQLNPSPWLRSPRLYAILYPLWQMAILLPLVFSIRPAIGPRDTEQLEWAAVVFSLLLLSPVPSSYHFVGMILSIVLVADVLARRRRRTFMVVVLALYVAISLIEFSPVSATEHFSLLTVVAFARLWIGILLMGHLILLLRLESGDSVISMLGRSRVILLALCFVVFWITGVITYQRHFAYLAEDALRRMPVKIPAYLATGMHASPYGYLFTAMVPTGYDVLDQSGKCLWNGKEEGMHSDQLSSAIDRSGSYVLLELADANGSRVRQVSSSAPYSGSAFPGKLLIPDAESPAISPDGSSVLFIREEHGRDRLWLGHVLNEFSRPRIAEPPTQIVASSYDVYDVTFAPSGTAYFTAKVKGQTNIFSLTPQGEQKLFLSEKEDVRSPSFSPDGEMVAYNQLIRRQWQLVLLEVVSGRIRVLTDGDCNAYAPTWMSDSSIGYSTDCGRGLGLTALAVVRVRH